MFGRRKGQTVGVDFAIAMSVFVISITTGIFYAIHVSLPSSPFSQQVRTSATLAGERFVESNSWNLRRTPVVVGGGSADGFPVEVDYIFPDTAFNSSIRAAEEDTPLRFQYDEEVDEVVFEADVSGPRDFFDIVYSMEFEGTRMNLSDGVGLEIPGADSYRVDNGDLESTVGSEGIEYIEADNSIRVEQFDMDISGSLVNVSGPVREMVRISDGRDVDIRFYGSSNLVRITDMGSPTYSINVSSGYDTVTVGDSESSSDVSISGAGNHVSQNADYFWMTGESVPVGFFLKDMDLDISRSAAGEPVEVEVDFTGSDRIWLYSGSSYSFENLRDLFYGGSYTTVPRTVSGVSDDRLERFRRKGYTDVADALGLSGMNYNITLGSNYSIGEPVPESQDIFVQEYPVSMMGDHGNRSATELLLAVWT